MSNKNPRTHLLLGPETGEKGVRLKAIRNSIRNEFGTDPEIYRFYPFETMNGEIFTALQNNSLFSEHRLVILSQAEDLSASQIKELEIYLKDPNDSATLVIISSDTRLPGKISALIPKQNTQVFWEMFDNRKPDWVRGVFSAAGYAVTADAVDLLLELVENTTQELRTTAHQLMQFIALEERDLVTEEDVEQFIQHTRPESVFTLFSHMATGTYEQVLDILKTLTSSGEGDAVPLIAGLLWQFRRLLSLENLLESGKSWEEATAQVSVMGKSVPIRRKKDNEIYSAAAERFPLEVSRRIIARIGEFDISTRQIGSDLQPLVLEQLMGVIMIRKGAPLVQMPKVSFFTDAKF